MMNMKDAFLKSLAENEDDITIRLVYADWLDEQGEHEEADRERRWPPAKEWLVRFCQEHSQSRQLTFPELIEFGRRAVQREVPRNASIWTRTCGTPSRTTSRSSGGTGRS